MEILKFLGFYGILSNFMNPGMAELSENPLNPAVGCQQGWCSSRKWWFCTDFMKFSGFARILWNLVVLHGLVNSFGTVEYFEPVKSVKIHKFTKNRINPVLALDWREDVFRRAISRSSPMSRVWLMTGRGVPVSMRPDVLVAGQSVPRQRVYTGSQRHIHGRQGCIRHIQGAPHPCI